MTKVLTNVDNYEARPKISHSEMYSFNRCSMKHHYRYREGLESRVGFKYFDTGKFVHSLMEYALATLKETGGITDEQLQVESMRLQTEGIEGKHVDEVDRAHHTNTVQEFFKQEINFEIEETELEFYADIGLPEGTLLHGKIDAVVRSKADGGLWLVEHKTAGKAWSDGQFTFDSQTPLYALAYETITGEKVQGVVFNFFYPYRKTKPQAFASIPMFIDQGEKAQWAKEAANVIELRSINKPTRQPHWGCGDCGFKKICKLDMVDPRESNRVKGTDFVVNEDRKARFENESS